MNNPIFDELEDWIRQARLYQDEQMHSITEQEAAHYREQYGYFELILGPFLIRRLDGSKMSEGKQFRAEPEGGSYP